MQHTKSIVPIENESDQTPNTDELLPDRTNLSELYPDIEKRKQIHEAEKITLAQQKDPHVWHKLAVSALLMPLPFLLTDFLISIQLDMNRMLFVLPVLTITALAMLGAIYMLYKSRAILFDKLGFNGYHYLLLYCMSLLLVAPLVRHACLTWLGAVVPKPLASVTYVVATLLVSVAILLIYGKIIKNSEWSSAKKNWLTAGMIFLCAIASLTYIAIRIF